MAESKAVSLVSANVPAHVKESAGLGNENVSTQHLQTPRVKLLQQMNSEVDESHDAYVEKAKPGDLLNTVTNEIYGTEIYVINVHFTEDFVVWRKREKGGGLVASCASRADADEMIGNQDGSPNDYEIIQTQSHLLIRKDATTGEMESTPFLMDFASSKLRVSREWNTQIAQLGGDRFSTLWKVSSVKTQNRAGQPFQNLSVMKEGWVTDDDYEIAKKVYKGVSGNTGA
jgi:hypothetical protein